MMLSEINQFVDHFEHIETNLFSIALVLVLLPFAPLGIPSISLSLSQSLTKMFQNRNIFENWNGNNLLLHRFRNNKFTA